MTVAVAASRLAQPLDLVFGQVFPRPQFGIALRRGVVTVPKKCLGRPASNARLPWGIGLSVALLSLIWPFYEQLSKRRGQRDGEKDAGGFPACD
jgi:hypothetical protein